MNLTNKSTTDFFNNEYVNYASYDNVRKIPSLVDGQKNAARKTLWYTFKTKLKNEIKLSQLDSKVAEDTEYLHGSMSGVIVNLAQNHVGTNNINLMMPEGNFGTRLVPEASAPRYIYTYGSNELFEILNQNDNEILEKQFFEGHEIEPKFLLPKLPMLLINGSEGISSGFACKILPRNPDEIKKYIKDYLKGARKEFNNKPFYQGFNGTIEQGESENQWVISGKYTRKGNKVHIIELPIGYSLKSYIPVLDKLEDDKKILNYQDLSNKNFEFVLTFNRKYLDSLDDEKLQDLLKLNKRVSENYTVTDENNRIKMYNNINEIMQHYLRVKLDYLDKRKSNMVSSLTKDIKELISKYVFIHKVTSDELIVSKRPIADIEVELENIDKIVKIDNNYDYLLNMSIRSLTKERMESLLKQINSKKEELDIVKKSTLENMWLNEI